MIPPGGVGKVTASLNTGHYKGPIAKSVMVKTGDGGTAPLVLQMKAQVVVPIEVLPNENIFLQGLPGRVRPSEITLAGRGGERFDVLAVQPDPRVSVTVKPLPPTAGHGTTKPARAKRIATGSDRYLVTLTPRQDLPLGRTAGTVTLTTTHPKAASVPLQVTVSVVGAVQVLPERVVFQPNGGQSPEPRTVKLRKVDGAGLKILGFDSSDPDFTATAATVNEGQEYDVLIRYVGKPGKGGVNSRLTVRTNEPRQRAIVIAIHGHI